MVNMLKFARDMILNIAKKANLSKRCNIKLVKESVKGIILKIMKKADLIEL